MITQILDDFDLEKIAESGQCFRWERIDSVIENALCSPTDPIDKQGAEKQRNIPENTSHPCTYRILAGNSCLYITELDAGQGVYELDCSEENFSSFWHSYFDLGENYSIWVKTTAASVSGSIEPWIHSSGRRQSMKKGSASFGRIPGRC